MSKDLIRYDLLVQDALKSVVRKVLGDAAKIGLPGEHHFYVSFRTEFPGVRLSQRLRDKYPQEMTIVVQHQFWDLAVTEHAFEVGLSFSGIPERLLIPFDAVTGFFDPSVQFGLKFEVLEAEVSAESAIPPGPRPARGAGSEPAEVAPASSQPQVIDTVKSVTKAGEGEKRTEKKKGASKAEAAEPDDAAQPKAEVVSLDAFRKKT